MRAPTDHFSSIARRYAEARPTYPDELFGWLSGQCQAHDMAWDAGAGNGQASVALAEHFASVLATDLSAEQLEQAPAREGVRYRVAPAHESGLPDGSTDLVTVAQALHWFDLPRFHGEVARVLKPGGLIAEWTYGIVHVEGQELDDLVSDFYHRVVGPHWPAERRHVENGYADLPFPFRPIPSPPFAMSLRWDLAGLLNYLRSWSATSRMQASTGVDPVDGLRGPLSALWGPPERTREIRWPLALRIGAR